jgi:hypothetical protein
MQSHTVDASAMLTLQLARKNKQNPLGQHQTCSAQHATSEKTSSQICKQKHPVANISILSAWFLCYERLKTMKA